MTTETIEIDRLHETIEDLEDRVLALQAELDQWRSGERGLIPDAVIALEQQGLSPLKAWRKHRGMTLQTLAAACAVSVGYLSDVERGKKDMTLRLLNRVAAALDAPRVAFLPDDD